MNCNAFHSRTRKLTYLVTDVCIQRDTDLLHCTGDHGLHQLIDQATRTTATSASTTDLIFTSHPENLVNSGVTPLGITDHDLGYCVKKYKSAKPPPKYVTSRNWKHVDVTKYQDDCANFLFNDLLQAKTIDSAWDILE